MAKLSLPPKPHIANCVGAGCPERESCLRYLRPAFRAHKDHVTGKVVVQLWASYNIDREKFGSCDAKLEAKGFERAVAKIGPMERAFNRARSGAHANPA